MAAPAFAGATYPVDDLYVRVDTKTPEDRAEINEMGLDILTVDLEKGSVWVRLPADELTDLLALPYNIEVLDVMAMPPAYEEYHSYAEQKAMLDDLHAQYPELTKVFSIGPSYEGRELWAIKISNNPEVDDPEKPAFLLYAQHHAREILTPEVALYTAKTLLESYGVDDQMTTYVDTREVYIVPTVNPDGAEYDQSGATFRMWRKTRTVNEGSNCRGVDLNRNYGYEWVGPGSSGAPCSETYRGASPFSEPETQALRKLINTHTNIRIDISLHSHAKLVLYPWGYTYQKIADQVDYQTHKTLAEAMAKFNKYTPAQASNLYPVNGDSGDWEYGEKGIIAYTIELEPSQLIVTGFYPQPSIIQGACERNFQAILLAIGLTRKPSLVLSTDLWRLEATLNGNAATIHWNSIIETKPQGWNVLRSEGASENYVQLNDQLIQAGQDDYTYIDQGLVEGTTYNYMVEYVAQNTNLNQQFGPVSVEMPGGADDDATDDDATDDDATDDDATDDDAADDDATDDDAGDDDDNDDDSGCGC